LAVAGTQTAGLAFGGKMHQQLLDQTQIQQKNITDQLGQVVEIWEQVLSYQRRLWNSNSCIIIWWLWTTYCITTEEYNGTIWTAGGTLVSKRRS
jgi:hypothetical protein